MTDDRPARLEELLAEYGLPAPASCCDLGGSWTRNLRLDYPDADSLVLRIHQPSTSAARLTALQSARRIAADAGIPAVPPRPTSSGNRHIRLQDGMLAELEPFVPWSSRMNTVPLLERGFVVLGRLHDVLRTTDLPAEAAQPVHANHVHADEAVATTRQGAARMRSWGDEKFTGLADRAQRHVEAVAAEEERLLEQLPRQLVHGDFWDNNVLFEGEKLAALLDFDFMGERHRIDDLALTIYFYLLEPGKTLPTGADRDVVRRFVAAYDSGSEHKLSATERAALPLAVARQPAWSMGRWIVQLDEPDARHHASHLLHELPVAQAILAELPLWQAALC